MPHTTVCLTRIGGCILGVKKTPSKRATNALRKVNLKKQIAAIDGVEALIVFIRSKSTDGVSYITNTAISKELGISKATVERRLNAAVELGLTIETTPLQRDSNGKLFKQRTIYLPEYKSDKKLPERKSYARPKLKLVPDLLSQTQWALPGESPAEYKKRLGLT